MLTHLFLVEMFVCENYILVPNVASINWQQVYRINIISPTRSLKPTPKLSNWARVCGKLESCIRVLHLLTALNKEKGHHIEACQRHQI